MSSDIGKLNKEKVFKRNVLKRLYGKEVDDDVKQRESENVKCMTTSSTKTGSNLSTSKPQPKTRQNRKVYTVALPPEGHQNTANCDLEFVDSVEEEKSTTSDASEDDDHEEYVMCMKRPRKSHSKSVQEEISNLTKDTQKHKYDPKNNLTKNQKRKLKKKRSKERNRKDKILTFVHASHESKDKVQQCSPKLDESEKVSLFEREKEKLLEFVDGVWDIMHAEDKCKGELSDEDINLKQKFDDFISKSKPDQFDLIQSLWNLKSSALLKNRTLVNSKIEYLNNRMQDVESNKDAVNFFFKTVNFWLDEIVKT